MPILVGYTVNSPREFYSVILVEIFLLDNANTESDNKYSQRMNLVIYRRELLILGLREPDANKHIRKPVLLLISTKQSFGE